MTSKTNALQSPPLSLLKRSDRIDRVRDVKWQQWPKVMHQHNIVDIDSLNCSHPDLEDGSLISWGLQQSQDSKGGGVDVDVLYGTGTDLRWPRNVNDEELSRIMELPAASLRICFVNTLKTDSSWLPGNFNLRPNTVQILRKAGLSGVLLCNLYSEQSYWAKMGNQKYMRYDDDGRLTSYEICYQYRCGWDTGVSFIHSIREKQRITYFCINFPSGARERLEAIFRYEHRRVVLHRDFFLDTLVADDSLKQWQFDIGQRRLMLLLVEKTLEKPLGKSQDGSTLNEKFEPSEETRRITSSVLKSFYKYEGRDVEQQAGPGAGDQRNMNTEEYYVEELHKSLGYTDKGHEVDFDKATRSLHKMVRHWLGLRQDCEDLLAQLRFLHDTYNKISQKRGRDWIFDRKADAAESFEVLISQCDICVRWTQVYHDRTQTRINMLFHLSNQRTAADTAQIAKQTQRDSASMITIAAVTMLFLPGTFVCTIVSTNLFDFGDNGLQVSSQWWILLAGAIPLTFVVFGVWLGWQRVRLQTQRRKDRLSDSELWRSSSSK